MQLVTSLTKSDYSAFRRYASFRLRKTWLMYLPLLGIVAWTAYPRGAGVPLAAAVCISLFVALLVVALALLLSLLLVVILPNRPGTVLGEHVYTLTDTEFQETNEAGSASVKFDRLRRYETATHVFLISATHVGYIVPKRALDSAPEFARILRERIRQR